MSPKKQARKSARNTAANKKRSRGFTDEERAAMKERAGPLAEDLVWDARVCQGRERRLLLSERAEVQDAVRDVRLQRQGEPRRRRHVADLVRPTELTAANEARIGALVKKAVS